MALPDKDYVLMLRVGDRVGEPYEIRLQRGDITKSPAEAIVNAANSELLPGGGVCGAIHRAAGPTVAEECRRISSERGPLSHGEAVTTTAGNLSAKYVIHTVGPVWHGGNHGEARALANCHQESMRVADELKLSSIAFPAISTGIFGYPVDQAAWVAIPTLIESLRSARNLVLVFLILFDKQTLDIFADTALAQRKKASGHPYEVIIAHA